MARFKTKAQKEAEKEEKQEKKQALKPKTIKELQNQIESSFGTGSIICGRGGIVKVDSISTGVISLDAAIGCGGLPRGRIIELYGPESGGKTTTTLQCIAACQRTFIKDKNRNGVVAFIDAEHGLDVQWAENIGVDMDTALISQPDSGEEGFTIVEMLVESGLVDLIIVDSVAALVPKAVLDGSISDSTMAALAQLMSKGMARIKGKCSKSKTTVIFINQIREKVGTIFGCLHGDTPINFVDGRTITIRKVVEDKINGEVWSYDEDKHIFVKCPIIDWHYNGKVTDPSDYLSILIKGPGTKNGVMNITVTTDHLVKTDSGWCKANELYVGSRLLTKQRCLVKNGLSLNNTLGAFLTGVLVGDSSICHNKHRGKLLASIRIRDNIDLEYARWKVSKLNQFIKFTEGQCRPGVYYQSTEQSEFLQIKNEYPKRDPMLLLDHFTWMGFAVWIMDDAIYDRNRYTLSIKRFAGDFDKIEQISRTLDEIGLYHYASKGGHIVFDKAVSDKIAANISEFVPPCMSRKLPQDLHNKYIDFNLMNDVEFAEAYATVVSIRNASVHQMKNKRKYDISIGPTNCYLAGGNDNGVVVHNSPELTPGGRALKFYASVRIEVKKISALKDGEDTIGFRTQAKIVKNKVAPPFMSGEYDICVGHNARPIYGIDTHQSLLETALAHKVISKSGNFYSYDNGKSITLGNGMKNATNFLRDNPDLVEQIQSKTRDILFGSIIPAEIETVESEEQAIDEEEN